MLFSSADVQALAHLARLEISTSELDATLAQLNNIFELIEQLRAVDTTGIQPICSPIEFMTQGALRLREDVVTESDRRHDYQKPAPAVQDDLYLVPRVLE